MGDEEWARGGGESARDPCTPAVRSAQIAQSTSCQHNKTTGGAEKAPWTVTPPVERVVMHWSSHSEAMLQAALDDVDWDMFWASSSDVSEFTDVPISYVNMLNEQATETVTIRKFSNQKPWVDRTIHDAVNQRTAAYNAGLLSLRRAVRATKLRYREIQGVSFSAQWLPTHVAGTEDHLLLWK